MLQHCESCKYFNRGRCYKHKKDVGFFDLCNDYEEQEVK